MGRFLWSQLLHRKSRTATLGLGILVAAVGFTLLTSAADTGAVQVRGTIAKNFRSAYDILVRPTNTEAALESEHGLVRPNFLSGIFGGITVAQWHAILKIPDVEVAAPVANLGYVIPSVSLHFFVARDLLNPNELFRVRFDWIATNGLSLYPGIQPYVYTTSDPRECRFATVHLGVRNNEPRTPFELNGPENSYPACVVMHGGKVTPTNASGEAEATVDAYFPVLIAAIDPIQEDRLVHLNSAVDGRVLAEGQGYEPAPFGPVLPVLASDRTYVDESLHVSVERLHLPAGASVRQMIESPEANALFGRLHGPVVGGSSLSAAQMYHRLLKGLDLTPDTTSLTDVWTSSPVEYRSVSPDTLAALPTTGDPEGAWSDPNQNPYFAAPPGNQDVQYRRVVIHNPSFGDVGGGLTSSMSAELDVISTFDPTKLPGFSPLSQVPIETYSPPFVEPADAASREALGGKPLLPTMNLGGYIQQPPFLLTTIEAGEALLDPRYFQGRDPTAPISAIRVVVAGVTGPDPLSLARIKQVALAIHQTTGLSVDITAGSSPTPMTVELPPGRFGQPALTVTEGWVKKGVAVVILQALDRKSVALFLLVLVVTALFLVNGGMAAVRTRRTEIGTLLALGWSREKVFRAVLSELALIGLTAGVVGTLVAAALVEVLGFRMPLARTLLVAPVATTLAVLAGLVPAWRASRCLPVDAVRPAVVNSGSGRPVRGVASMALADLRRLPGRTLLGAAGLFVGVGALALLLSITLAFQGSLVGTALGTFISVQVRGVDYLGVGLALGLAALSVADVLFLNLKERAPEIVTLQASGWRDAHITGLVSLEGLGIGILGSVAGALAGLALSSLVGVSAAHIAGAGAIAALAGVGVAVVASLVPASLASRMTAPTVLGEE